MFSLYFRDFYLHFYHFGELSDQETCSLLMRQTICSNMTTKFCKIFDLPEFSSQNNI